MVKELNDEDTGGDDYSKTGESVETDKMEGHLDKQPEIFREEVSFRRKRVKNESYFIHYFNLFN